MYAAIGVALMIFTLSSCSSVKQLQTDCDMEMDELFKSITTLLMQEGFEIKQSDFNLGYLKAETPLKHNLWVGVHEKYIWIFQYDQGVVIATAKHYAESRNAFGNTMSSSETYYADHVHKDHDWYWNIRNGLEKLCKNRIIVIEKE